MTETKKTIIFIGAAVILSLLALLVAPRKITPEAFQDQGTKFFADFNDPNEATTLEVVEYDSVSNTTKPFKVTFAQNRWTIPSHNDYPADAKDRLAKTAGGVIDIVKDDYRTDSPQEYEALGVVDPLEESAGSTGRGKRVTLKAADGRTLADFIIGNQVPGKTDYRFVRVPGEKRVYASKVNVDISTRFEDWIEPDLLKVTKDQINKIVLHDYSIDERTLGVNQRDVVTLTRGSSGWRFEKGGKPDSAKTQAMLSALDELKIVGVRPKPKGLSEILAGTARTPNISQSDLMSLQGKGYYLTREGEVLSNEGELQFSTDAGIRYTLRFGEIAYGTGEALTAGTGNESANSGVGENRYLFVSVDSDASTLKEPPKAQNLSFQNKPDSLLTPAERAEQQVHQNWQQWKTKVDNTQKTIQDLNQRFAYWYYVIPATSFEQLHLSRRELQSAS